MEIDDERLRQALLSEALILPTTSLPSTQMWHRLEFRLRYRRERRNRYWDSAGTLAASLFLLIVILSTIGLPPIAFSLVGLLIPTGIAALVIGSMRIA